MNNILSSVAGLTNANQAPQLSNPAAERVDIHKSCKSLETLLNILNDYCEAATAIVTLQKKLVKALRDTASSKVTNETAGNALNASASIFEALAEVDSKFIKIADREYDSISTEVKRWFKKLAKEERAHDERIANANARIKHAGTSFEKKSRKKSLDAQEEHSRYIHLISTLGPEITQEKYNHLLQTTQRHTVTIYSVAACLSRIADTEWVRSCECVRRFAPTVGPLGEWRSFCEGGWMRNIPGDLINLETRPQDNLKLNTIKERAEAEEEIEEKNGAQQSTQIVQEHQDYEHTSPSRHLQSDDEVPMPDPQNSRPITQLNLPRGEREPTTSTSTSYPSQTQSSSPGNSPVLPQYKQNLKHDSTPTHTYLSPPTPSAPTPGQAFISPATSASASPHVPAPEYPSEYDPIHDNLRPLSPISRYPQSRSRDESPTSDDHGHFFSDPATGSVRSLSAFPAPPKHFPLPPPRPKDTPPHTSARPSVSVIRECREEPTYAAKERLSESPLPLEYAEDNKGDDNDNLTSPPRQRQPHRPSGNSDRHHERDSHDIVSGVSPDKTSPQIPTAAPHVHGLQSESSDKDSTYIPEREFRPRDFGVLREERVRGTAARALTFSGGISAPPPEDRIEFPSTSMPSQKRSSIIERTDTGTAATRSIVAAMKSRYSSTDSRSPPPRVDDLPRLQTSVTEIVNRYKQPPPTQDTPATHTPTHTPTTSITDAGDIQEQQSPRIKQSLLRPLTKSPPPLMDRHASNPSLTEKMEPHQYASSTPITPPRRLSNTETPRARDFLDGSEERAQWRRVEARERELQDREQEIVMRERELERDRARLLAVRDGLASSSQDADGSGYGPRDPRDPTTNPQSSGQPLQSRPRRISFRRSRQNSQPPTPQLRQEQLHPPTEAPSLNPAISSPNMRERPQSNHLHSSPPPSSSPNDQDRGLSYLSKSTGSPPLQQGQQPQEKKGGWMRRLSMPVGSALPFSLDSSKRNTNNSNSSTSSNQNTNIRPLGAGIVGGKGVDEKRNSVTVALGIGARESRDGGREYEYEQQHQRQMQEPEGRQPGDSAHGLGRKSFDATRSASNLNLGRTKY